MDLEYEDIVAAVKQGISPEDDKQEQIGSLMAVTPFDALDCDGGIIKVVGLAAFADGIKFISIVTDEDGEMFISTDFTVNQRPPH